MKSMKTTKMHMKAANYLYKNFPRHLHGPVAQWIRHLTTNQGIPGSSPGRVESFRLRYQTFFPAGRVESAVSQYSASTSMCLMVSCFFPCTSLRSRYGSSFYNIKNFDCKTIKVLFDIEISIT